ncbi:cytochrome c biogenesis protein CcsA [Thauera sp.]|jgi:cytochrome c-type biogenesis protein CcmF|uniref:cytochrome c biogenesis protein CcsA n=1 Tax=Thauera sp. TaxID=1905334 RepID=UPI002A358AA3|nr:cytochrome c biogenesis protein CcsA [Thauera sp.]MDX9884157.1 cytochrome c biogenesis protein CcsA [Thauera sp.]
MSAPPPALLSLAVTALAAALVASWAALGQVALAAAAVLAAHAAFRPPGRRTMLTLAATLTWACVLALGWHFAHDHFVLRYVWLYSSTELPLHLKIANLWGGDEGTTLLLAACCLSLAAAEVRAVRDPSRLSVFAVIATWYGVTALWLAPFAATPAEWLAQSPSQGMNAHLMKPWMLFHAPLVLAAYAWTLSLAAPALEALRGLSTPWPPLARLRARRAWMVLTAGIGFGMLWAFEDAMYGQVWHWDPVQTAVFCLWCLLGAHLHGVGGWGVGRRHWRAMPWAGALAAAAVPLVMAVTRNPMLASSHRYVGADSWVSHVILGTALLLAAVGCAIAGWRAGAGLPCATERRSSGLGLWLAQLCFLGAAVAAAGQLLFAFAASALELPRPEEYKPFLAMLSNLTTGAELAALRAAFEQWDVDGYVLARGLLLPLAGFGLVGGWYFFRRISKGAGHLSLPLALAAMWATAAWGGPMTKSYAGAGILSQQIVAVLPLFDASLVGGAYLALGGIAWAATVLRQRGRKGLATAIPLAAIHVGVALALWGGLLATALNSYTQHEIRFDGAQTGWAQARHGYAFRIADVRVSSVRDGGVNASNGVQALTAIEVRSPAGEVLDGQTLYRDSRAPPERYDGPLRQVCELLDYRYARHMGAPGYLLQPLIDQGWASAVQFWVSPAAVVESLADRQGGAEVIVVVKVFPFLSLLWSGLLLVLFGSGWFAFFSPREPAWRH